MINCRPLSCLFLLLFLLPPAIHRAQAVHLSSPIRYLALGDSYTIGQGVAESDRWPVQLRDALLQRGYAVNELRILATTGWTTGDLLSALSRQSPGAGGFNLVSLLIGVNNQYQGRSLEEFRQQFRQLLDSALVYTGQDTAGLFVLSIPDYAYTPFGGGDEDISAGIDRFNAAKREIVDEYGIFWCDITPISREGLDRPELVAADGLHPSGIQYALWVDTLLAQWDGQATGIGLPAPQPTQLRLARAPAADWIEVFGLRQLGAEELRLLNAGGQTLFRWSLSGAERLRLSLEPFPRGLLLLTAYRNDQLIGRARIQRP